MTVIDEKLPTQGRGTVGGARIPAGQPELGPAELRRRTWLRRLKSAVSVLIGLALFGLSLYVLRRWASKISLDQLIAELVQIPATDLLLAVLFTFGSFAALVGYEFYAVRYVGRRMPFPMVALYSFITQSVAHAVGFAIFVGAGIRYKLYARHGFSLVDIAKIQVFFTTTFGLGALTLIGGVFLIEPGPLANGLGLPHGLWRISGVVLLAVVVAFIVFGAWRRRPIPIFGEKLAFPEPHVTVIQVFLGVADLLAVAAALYVLMPDALGLDYFEMLGIFVAAVTIGLVSNVPGSLGVFESAVILLVDPSEELAAPLLGALIAFRSIYYMLPLVLGATGFGVIQARRWAEPTRETEHPA